MPSTATITAFYNFSANTKARASQVNINFDNFRGHMLPISPTTATGSNLTYDLGSVDYRWRSVYAQSLDFLSNTTTSQQIVLQGSTSGGETFLSMNINGSETARVGPGGLQNLRTSALLGYTTSAAAGGFASRIVDLASAGTTTATNIANSTVTISTIGRPISSKILAVAQTSSSSYFSATQNLNTSASWFTEITLIRDNSVSCGTFSMNFTFGVTTTGQNFLIPSSLQYMDFPASGSHTYHLTFRTNANGAVPNISFYGRLVVYEIN